MQFFLAASGVIVVFLAVVDIVWTTIGTHGGGPLSKHLNKFLWRCAVALHRRKNNHRALSFVGSLMLVTTVVFWVALVWLGWFLLFSSDPMSIVETSDPHKAVDAWSRVYFVGYSMFTLGNGDLRPNGPLWRVITSIACGSGLGAVTLAITFLLEVLGAVVETRTLAAYISGLGGTPKAILERAWTGEIFDSLEQHLIQLTVMVHLYTEQHLAYPVLHYFHSESPRTAASLRVVALHEAVMLLAHGADPEKRLPMQVTRPLQSAIHAFAKVITTEYVPSERNAPSSPSLEILREIGVPTVSDEAFLRAVEEEDEVRRALISLLHDDGRSWREMMEG